MREAVIVSAVRTPVGKAKKGTLKDMRPDDMAASVIAEAVKRTPGLRPEEIDDVILGCAMPEAEQGMNVARIASLRAGLPPEVSAITINRFCSSGLAIHRVRGRADSVRLGRGCCGWGNRKHESWFPWPATNSRPTLTSRNRIQTSISEWV